MHEFLEDLTRGRARVGKLAGLAAVAVGMGIAFPFAVDLAVAKIPALYAILRAEGHRLGNQAALFPVAMFGVTMFCLVLEAWLLGYRRSTLRSVIHHEAASVRTDVFFFLFRISGLMIVFCLLFSLGGMYVAADYIEAKLGFAMMRDVDSILLQFVSIVVLLSFINYWLHRLLHSPILWEIHKVHHSAEDINVLLPYRNHPVDFMLAIFQGAIVTAVLGVKPEATVMWLALNSVTSRWCIPSTIGNGNGWTTS